MVALPCLSALNPRTLVAARLPNDLLRKITLEARDPLFRGELCARLAWNYATPNEILLTVDVNDKDGRKVDLDQLREEGRAMVASGLQDAMFRGLLHMEKYSASHARNYLVATARATVSLRLRTRVRIDVTLEAVVDPALQAELTALMFETTVGSPYPQPLLSQLITDKLSNAVPYARHFFEGVASLGDGGLLRHQSMYTEVDDLRIVNGEVYGPTERHTPPHLNGSRIVLEVSAPVRMYDRTTEHGTYEALSFVEFNDGHDLDYELRRAARQPARDAEATEDL